MFTLKYVLSNNLIQKHCFTKIIGIQCLHYSDASKFLNQTPETTPSQPPLQRMAKKNRKKDPPSDFLPFPWTRKRKHSLLRDSGDLVTFLEVDPTLPKPDFEFSEELKSANEEVKKFFSLDTAAVQERKEACLRETIKRVQRHPLDFDSLEVKIAERTITVRNLYEHKDRIHKRDIRNTRFILPIMIQKRNKLLYKLWQIDTDRFNWILKELKLYFNEPFLGTPRPRYTRKSDMRRMTKEYCEKMIADKRAAYHETLKQEQELFKEEKAKALAWIAEEEKAIKALDVVIENNQI